MFARRTMAALATTATLFAVGAASATTASAGDVIITPPIDTTAMGASIEQSLEGVPGFAYAIAVNGQLAKSGSAGKARKAPDGNVNFTTSTRMEIASATKNFTAAAVLKLLEANPTVNVGMPVWPFLPEAFKSQADPSWKKVTFRHLLSHTSGLEQAKNALSAADQAKFNRSYTGLQFAVTKKVTPTGDAPSQRQYSNEGYAMLRLVIPVLWRLSDSGGGVPSNIDPSTYGPWTLAYVNKHLLAPAGIAATTCVATNPSTAALGYDLAKPTAAGHLFELAGDGFEQCAGHRGLHLSAMDLVRWQAHLAHGTVVSAAVRNQMDTMLLGWREDSNGPDRAGMFWHGGQENYGGSVTSCVMKFPGGVEASVLYNSKHPDDTYSCRVLLDGYWAGQ